MCPSTTDEIIMNKSSGLTAVDYMQTQWLAILAPPPIMLTK